MLSLVRRLLVAPLVIFALLAALVSAYATGSAAIAFSPQNVTATIGAAVAVDVTVANVDPNPGLAAYDLTLHFNPTVVRLDSLSDAGFVTTPQNLVICMTGQIDNVGGTVNATCTAIPLLGAPGVSAIDPVALLHASFTALAAGSSPLTLSGSLSSPTGIAIATSFASGTIHVTAAASASSPTAAPTTAATGSPAASPTPTVTASPTPPVAATTVAAIPATPSPTGVIAGVKAPATGNGGGSPGGNLTGIVLIGGAITALFASLLLLWRYRVKTHT